MDENEVLDVQENTGNENPDILTDLEPEVVEPNEGGINGGGEGMVDEGDVDDNDNTDPTPSVEPTTDPEPEENPTSEDAAKKAHAYYVMQMLSIIPGM